MSPQVQAYRTFARQITTPAGAPIPLLDRDAYPAQLLELSDMAMTIARFGTAETQLAFYDLLATEPDISQHVASDILQYFQPPADVRKRAVSVVHNLPHYH